jgi:hypothetical protein
MSIQRIVDRTAVREIDRFYAPKPNWTRMVMPPKVRTQLLLTEKPEPKEAYGPTGRVQVKDKAGQWVTKKASALAVVLPSHMKAPTGVPVGAGIHRQPTEELRERQRLRAMAEAEAKQREIAAGKLAVVKVEPRVWVR